MYGPPHWAALKAVHTHTNMCTYMQLWIHVLCLAAQCVYTCTLLTLVLLHFRGLYIGYIQCSPTRSCHCSRLTDCSGWAAEPAGDNNTSSVLPSCCLAVVLLPSVATGWGESVVLLSQLETQDAEDTQAQTQFGGDTQTHTYSSYSCHETWRWRGLKNAAEGSAEGSAEGDPTADSSLKELCTRLCNI